ncbi:MAG: murein L,D-transpeptidase YafK, partial [Planctomycetota bacterium]
TDRKMYLLHGKEILKSYDVDLGFDPLGHKSTRGDGRTPEGSYFIDRRNPNSLYHLSIGISYPNAADIAHAKSLGESPGGDIFIHGGPTLIADKRKADWTAGCISVTNKEMRQIYAMVQDGTQIDILP